MKTKTIALFAAAVLAALALGYLIGQRPSTAHTDDDHAHEAANGPEIWTCSMHPQIQQPAPGDCPICGMDLIPLDAGGAADLGPRTLEMSASAVALAQIETTRVERRFPEATISLVGQIAHDETRLRSLTARFPARVEELFVNYTGIRVAAGEHLALVYSPELMTAQRELLAAWKANPESLATAAARERLRQWDLLPDQIAAITANGALSDRFELKAPVGGTVIRRMVSEGDYVQTGQALFQIADLEHLWLRLDAFESDLPALRYGQRVRFTVNAYPGETFEGALAFIAPEVDPRTRTVPVRVNVPNPDGRLRPGMLARAEVVAQLAAEGTTFSPELAGKWISPMHPEIVKDGPGQCDVCGMALVPAEQLGLLAAVDAKAPLVVPASAVLRTGPRSVVYVQVPEAEQPTFEGREIVLGPRAGDVFVVREGLAEGDLVVTKGAFKLDSSLQIQAKRSMMHPDDSIAPDAATSPSLEIPATLAGTILPAYFDLQSALAADDLDRARAALQAMMAHTGHQGALPDLLHVMLAAEDLEGLRRPHFETLSQGLIDALRDQPGVVGHAAYQMHCPMVYPDRGADWLQADAQLRNPYFGSMMLQCGEVVGQIGTTEASATPE